MVHSKTSGNSQENTSAYNFIKKETLAQVFPSNFVKCLGIAFSIKHLKWQLSISAILLPEKIMKFQYFLLCILYIYSIYLLQILH